MEKLAYIAGLVDGEGTLLIGKYPRNGNKYLGYRGYMGISNTNIPMLLYAKGIIGGKICAQKKATGPYIGSVCYNLSLTTNQIREQLPKILNFLVAKKDQAEVLLAFLDRQASNASAPVSEELLEFYENCYQRLKEMKKVRYSFKEEEFSLGMFDCAQCGEIFERTSKNPKKVYCSVKCKKIVHYTRSNHRISLGIPAWDDIKGH